LKHPSYIVGYLLKPDVVSDDSSIKNFIFDDQKLRKTLLFFAILKKKLAREKKHRVKFMQKLELGIIPIVPCHIAVCRPQHVMTSLIFPFVFSRQ
jgi:hypothetical protein